MKRSRTKNAFLSISTSLVSEGVALVCGLVLPRLILSSFGSAYNAITQSITQFISYISLMKAGIGGATAVALYKPLADNDTEEINEILASTQKFMRKIAYIFVAFILVLSVVYPLFIVKDFDWWFTASLIFIISMTTFAQYYFGFTYQTLLSADQKDYITTTLEIVTTVLNTLVAVILINNNCSLHIVKLGSSLVNIIPPVFLYVYCHKKYHLHNVEPKEDKIPQKWDAAAHEVASFINNNTDVVILTLFSNLLEISVYTVYHYVIANIKKIVTKFTVGFGSAFGDMYARNEIDLMHQNLSIFELIIYSFTSILYSVTLVMMIPFVIIYTHGVTDVNYVRPLFSLVLVIGGVFNCFRVPYRVITIAAGHYKQTRNGAIAEALRDGKRTNFAANSGITTLADISIYTVEGELKLKDVFHKLQAVLGEADAPTSKASADEIKALFEKAVPDYDGDRFYVSHMKKVVDWYNELKQFASLDFVEEDGQAEGAAE